MADNSNTTKVKAASTLSTKQRERLEALFVQRYRKAPTPDLKPLIGRDDAADRIIQKLKGTIAYGKVLTAMSDLKMQVEYLYGQSANFSVGHDGTLVISYDYGRSSQDLVNNQMREANAAIQAANKGIEDEYAPAQAAWSHERQEKITAIHTARSIEELLAVVPELRVDLPTEADRALNAGYTPMQITAKSVVIDV